MNLIQFVDAKNKRAVGLISDGKIIKLKSIDRMTSLATRALKDGKSLNATAKILATATTEDYTTALKEKRVLPPLTHDDAAHCIITGTGLTHLGSASARDSMHQKLEGGEAALTDSLKMFKQGLEGGKPAKGEQECNQSGFIKAMAAGSSLPVRLYPSRASRSMAAKSQNLQAFI
jgi:hypothetical protein